MLKSKIYGIKVLEADLACDGSITIDKRILDDAGIEEYEQVHVLDITNAKRFITYAILGAPGELKVNGAAAKLVEIGDALIVLAYGIMDELENAHPKKVDGRNYK
jgi:aspartate 1-decarboxylase